MAKLRSSCSSAGSMGRHGCNKPNLKNQHIDFVQELEERGRLKLREQGLDASDPIYPILPCHAMSNLTSVVVPCSANNWELGDLVPYIGGRAVLIINLCRLSFDVPYRMWPKLCHKISVSKLCNKHKQTAHHYLRMCTHQCFTPSHLHCSIL